MTPKSTVLRPGSLIVQTEGLDPVTSEAAPCPLLTAFSSWLPSQPLTAPPRHRTLSPAHLLFWGPTLSRVPETNTKRQRPAEVLPRAPALHTTSSWRSKGGAGLQQPDPKYHPPAPRCSQP